MAQEIDYQDPAVFHGVTSSLIGLKGVIVMNDKLLQELELIDVQLNTIIKNQVLICQKIKELKMQQREKAAVLSPGQG